MNVYLKGAVLAALVAGGVFAIYSANVGRLPVNQAPAGFKVIDAMEEKGVPDFELERLDGSKLRLSSLKGKVLVVNFWASWCNPCVEEFPSMVRLADVMGDDVAIVAISTDDDRKDIENFAKLFNLPRKGFEVVWDKDKSVMKSYGVEKIPESFLVGHDMKLIRKVLGVEDWASPRALEYFKGLVAKHKGGSVGGQPLQSGPGGNGSVSPHGPMGESSSASPGAASTGSK